MCKFTHWSVDRSVENYFGCSAFVVLLTTAEMRESTAARLPCLDCHAAVCVSSTVKLARSTSAFLLLLLSFSFTFSFPFRFFFFLCSFSFIQRFKICWRRSCQRPESTVLHMDAADCLLLPRSCVCVSVVLEFKAYAKANIQHKYTCILSIHMYILDVRIYFGERAFAKRSNRSLEIPPTHTHTHKCTHANVRANLSGC